MNTWNSIKLKLWGSWYYILAGLCIVFVFALIIFFFWSIYSVFVYVGKHGLKSIVEQIWYGSQQLK